MELLFKLYADRPSRMGVDYKYSFQAVKAYELLLSKGAGQQFHLALEILSSTLKLVLTSEQNGFSTTYKDVELKSEPLRRLIACVEQKKFKMVIQFFFNNCSRICWNIIFDRRIMTRMQTTYKF